MDNTLDNVLHCKAAVKGAWGVPQQVTGTALLYIRKHCLPVQCTPPGSLLGDLRHFQRVKGCGKQLCDG